MTTTPIYIHEDAQYPSVQHEIPILIRLHAVHQWILNLPPSVSQGRLDTSHSWNVADSNIPPLQDELCSPAKRRKLAHLSTNIMPRSPEFQRRKSPRKASDTSLPPAPQARSTTPENVGLKEEIDPDSTPRSTTNVLPYRVLFDPLGTSNISSTFSPPPPSSGTSPSTKSTKSRTRSLSPSKKLRNMQLSRNPMRWTSLELGAFPLPRDVLELLDDIRNIADGEEVIPLSIASLLAEASDRHRIKARNIEKEGTNSRSDLSDAEILRLAVELRTKTLECREEDLSEASWNDGVHSSLLDLALRGHWRSQGLRYRNITSARIDDPQLISSAESRMVDYCITFGSNPEFVTRIRDFLHRGGLQSINHTSAPGIGFTPIAVSIETKRGRIDEEDARHQLGTWVTAHFAHLRRLSRPGVNLPSLLLIMVQAHEWRMCIASSGDGLSTPGIIFRDIQIGDTTTLTGIFTAIKALNRIARHVVEVHIPWFESEILCTDPIYS